MNSLYLPGLNGIRALAAMIVLLAHIWQYQYWFGFGNPIWIPYRISSMGVTLFFVLSGFLITYLLIQEKNKFKTVSIGKFYIRRILRIWPLYYALLLLSFLLIEHDLLTCLYYYYLFLPNWAFAVACAPAIIAPLWSVGVEEQFYLIWPLVIRYSRNHLIVLILVVIVYSIIKVSCRLYGSDALNAFVAITRIDCMAIGGIGAWWALSNQTKRNLVFNDYAQIILWALFVFFCFTKFQLPDFLEQEIYAIIFMALTLNVSINPRPILSLQSTILDWIGRISYGIYLTHMAILYILSILIGDKLKNVPLGLLFYGIICIISVMIVSSLSYFYFERYFIGLKSKFMMIQTSTMPESTNK